MDKKSPEAISDLRRQHNQDLIRRMRSGESLNSFDSKASWYPPRPIIKKDIIEIARLYGPHGRSPGAFALAPKRRRLPFAVIGSGESEPA